MFHPRRVCACALVCCLLLQALPAWAKGLGVSFDQAIGTLDTQFALKRSDLADGRMRYMGTTEDKLCMLEIIGPKADIEQVTLISAVANDAPGLLMRNGLFALSLFKNVIPEWPDATRNAWFDAAIRKLARNPTSPDSGSQTVIGNKRVGIKSMLPLGIFYTIEPR